MSFIKRITEVALNQGPNPSITPLYREKRKRKVSGFLKPVDKAQRKAVDALQVFGTELRVRNERSARKKNNGALMETGSNVRKAGKKALRRIRK
jgi:hypothetical protein